MSETNIEDGPLEDNDYSCFGEYGSRWYCKKCKQAMTCKQFTLEQKKSIYLRYKSKYRGRGKWRRKDYY